MPSPQGVMKLNVKCRICGKSIDKNTAYKILKGKVNTYYCSEKEYTDYLVKQSEQQQKKKDTYALIEEFIGKTTNTILFKEVGIWLTVADYDTICGFLKDNKERIQRTLNKDFVSEYAKIRYFSAIVKNGIGDYKPPVSEPVHKAETEIYESKYKSKTRRKCLNDYLEDGD